MKNSLEGAWDVIIDIRKELQSANGQKDYSEVEATLIDALIIIREINKQP